MSKQAGIQASEKSKRSLLPLGLLGGASLLGLFALNSCDEDTTSQGSSIAVTYNNRGETFVQTGPDLETAKQAALEACNTYGAFKLCVYGVALDNAPAHLYFDTAIVTDGTGNLPFDATFVHAASDIEESSNPARELCNETYHSTMCEKTPAGHVPRARR